MGALTGIAQIGAYDSDVMATNIQELIDLIPDPDINNATTAGAQAGGGNLDEMSVIAAAHLRVELEALKSAGGSGNLLAAGVHTITADEATANLVDIETGVTGLTLSKCAVSVWNGTTLATSDAVITEPTDGTIRVADGSTYNTVAGYVIRWAVFA